MKVIITCLSLLSFCSLVSSFIFSGWKNGKDDGAPQTKGRKVVLVPRTVYMPVYTSDDSPLEPKGPLTPLSSFSLASVPAVGPPQPYEYYYAPQPQQPPPDVYARYGPGYASSFLYGAVGPQSQYAAASFDMSQYTIPEVPYTPAAALPEGPIPVVPASYQPPVEAAVKDQEAPVEVSTATY